MTRLFCSIVASICVLTLIGCSTTYPRQALYLSCKQGKQVLVYDIDPKTGSLTETQRIDLPGPGGPITLTDDAKHFYAVAGNPSTIVSMRRDTATGELTKLAQTKVTNFPTYLDIDATSRFAITASYGAGMVDLYPLLEDRTVKQGPPSFSVATDKTAHASLIDPSNRFVYIPHTKPNAIYQFRFDENSGKLQPLQPLVVKGGGKPGDPAGPRHYVYHPTIGVVYAVNELDSSVGAYYWDKKTGQLARFQKLNTLPPNFGAKNTCADIHITPDGKFLYATNRGHDSIAAYRLDEFGQMTFIDWFKTEAWPREFTIDLSGRYLYCAGLKSHKLAAYRINPKTGRLSRFATYDTPKGPIWVEPAPLD